MNPNTPSSPAKPDSPEDSLADASRIRIEDRLIPPGGHWEDPAYDVQKKVEYFIGHRPNHYESKRDSGETK